MTTSNAPGLYLDSGEFVPAAELAIRDAYAITQSINIEAAAMKLAECMDYPWESMPEQGRGEMRKHAKAILVAAGVGRNGGL